jgi:predicted transcriptional regulator
MGEATFTFRVDAALKAEFDAVAKATDRTAEELLQSLMLDYLQDRERQEYDAWFIAEVTAGIAEADAGDVIPHEEVEAEAAAWRAELRRRIAAGES